MKLNHLVAPWLKLNEREAEIAGLSNDTRLIKPGEAFLAYPGQLTDGRLFIDQALALGAGAIIYDPQYLPINLPATTIPCLAIANLAEQVALLAQRFYQRQGDELVLTGVTGTNGKTTIAYQLAQTHSLLGQKAAYIGTLGQGLVNQLAPLENTTPDALCLHQLLYHYPQQGFKRVCLEVSSHALAQNRVQGLHFEQAIFTNLTLDHLDYHHSMEAYAAAKALLFSRDELKQAVINHDDAYQALIINALKPHVSVLTYGLQQVSDVRALHWHTDLAGSQLTIQSPWGHHEVKIKALGQFNIYNSLALWSSLLLNGYSPSAVSEVLAELQAAPGRLELVAQKPYVLIDYAHTPDALEKVLLTLKGLKQQGQLWVVFGCGGDRDKSKRPLMGKIASTYADHVVLTSDNPRRESPEGIMAEIRAGILAPGHLNECINREEAIAYALANAAAEDLVLIAGKGHETYQQIGQEKKSYSDHQVVKKIMG